MLVMIRGNVTVETLPVDVSIPCQYGNAKAKGGKEDSESQYKITRALTIWLSLRDNSGGGDDCCRNHSRE
jgi:hypothetical protein